jgi:predicted aspartyl protease
MSEPMGTFRIDFELESFFEEGRRAVVREALVDTGAESSWVPTPILESLGIPRRKTMRFRQANGEILERWMGPASFYVNGIWTVDEVVFGEPGDLVLLGARTLEGLNLRVDPRSKTLVDAGPAPAAASSTPIAMRSMDSAGTPAGREASLRRA